MISSISVYPGAEITPGKRAVMIKSFVDETAGGSSIVDVVEGHDPNDSYSNYTKKVYAFVPMANFGTMVPGLEAEVWPVTADKYTHGHMVGKISYVNAFVASDDDIKSIVGLDSDIPDLKKLGNVGIVEIELQPDPNTESGYY